MPNKCIPTESRTDASAPVEEIVVTAQKRGQSIQDVSLVAAVLGVAVVLFGLREPKPGPTGTRGRS